MFCVKCGSRNPEDANFCEQCGEKIPQKRSIPTTQPINQPRPQSCQATQPQQKYQNIYSNHHPSQQRVTSQYSLNQYAVPQRSTYQRTTTVASKSKNAVGFYITTLIFHAMAIILFFVPCAYEEVHIFTRSRETSSMFASFVTSSLGLAFVIVVIKLLSAFLTALPLFTANKKPSKLIIPKIITILELLWLIIFILALFSTISVNESRVGAGVYTAGLTFGGILYLISLLSLLILLFVTSAKSKEK